MTPILFFRTFAFPCLLLLHSATILAAVDANVLRDEEDRIAAMQKAAPAAAAVFSPDGSGGGSGVVISADGFALTNYHVVQPCGTAMIVGLPDGRLYDAVLAGIDPTGDMALIKLLGRDDFPCAELADSDLARVGDKVFALGNPFMLAADLQPTVTWGILSGTHRYQFPAGTILEYADCLQTDAAINPGNSGGPLFNNRAQLIGINGRCSFEKRGRVSVGVGYAISSNQAQNFLGHLRGGLIVDHATLGAIAAFDAAGRVVVDDILEDSDAYRRGLRYGDEIVSFAGRDVDTPNAFKNVLGTLPAGWRVPLTFRRDGRRQDILVRLAGVHSRGELLEKIKQKPLLPEPHQPKDDKKDGGKTPKPLSPGPNVAPPPLPEIVKKHFQEKRGYANYFFNLAARRRALDAWAAEAGLKWPDRQAKPWTIDAFTRSGQKAAIELSNDTAAIRSGDKTYNWSVPKQEISLDPPGSGGLLMALYLWHRLNALGPDAFADLAFAGVAPYYSCGQPGAARSADVLEATATGALARFYFDGETHDLAVMELFADGDADPCEVYFHDYRKLGGRRLPARIEARYGDNVYEIFTLDPPTAAADKTPATKNRKPRPTAAAPTSPLIRDAQEKVVKIQGAGGFRGLEAYQSGILISPRGHILTALSAALASDALDVTLDDGRRLQAALVGADPRLEIAVLKIPADDLPYFPLDANVSLGAGARILALGNLFGVAVGNEPVSVLRGVVSSRTNLAAGLGAFDTPYDGPAYVLDAATNNPGAAGGALVDSQGRLAGMLGKELQNRANRTWLNYALPVAELKKSADAIISGRSAAAPREERPKAAKPLDLEKLGLLLVPDLLDRTPPYVDSLRPDSPAQKAGLQPDDLVVLVGDRLVQSRKQFLEELSYIPDGAELKITVMRGRELIEIVLK